MLCYKTLMYLSNRTLEFTFENSNKQECYVMLTFMRFEADFRIASN